MSGLVRGDEIDNTAGCSRAPRVTPAPGPRPRHRINQNQTQTAEKPKVHFKLSVSKHWVVVFVQLCDSSESPAARGQALVAGPL